MEYAVYQLAPLDVIGQIQEFRASIYAIDNVQLTRDELCKDFGAWHVICRKGTSLVGCIRYLPGGIEDDRPTAQVGGWAVAPAQQGTSVALKLLFAGYAIGQALGGAIVASTATVRHRSAEILARVGGRAIKRYFDPHYQCEMCLMVFDTARVDKRFNRLLEFGQSVLPVNQLRTGGSPSVSASACDLLSSLANDREPFGIPHTGSSWPSDHA